MPGVLSLWRPASSKSLSARDRASGFIGSEPGRWRRLVGSRSILALVDFGLESGGVVESGGETSLPKSVASVVLEDRDFDVLSVSPGSGIFVRLSRMSVAQVSTIETTISLLIATKFPQGAS